MDAAFASALPQLCYGARGQVGVGQVRNPMPTVQIDARKRRSNRRLALVLFAVAAAVFILFIVMTALG
jgi:hypothetical protein